MKLTVNIFKDFINTLTLVGEVSSFSDDGTSTTLNVNATFHVRRGMSITINAVDFVVTSVVIDTTIIITGLPVGVPFYSVAPPFYFHGTPIGINQEINGESVSKKAPMIYLYEVFPETEMDENSSIIRESDIRLFFLDDADFENFDTEDYYALRLEGLNSLVDQFILAYRKSRSFFSFDTTFKRTNFTKWGVIANNKGAIKNIFDDELTGIELTFTAKLTDCEGEVPPFIPVCPPPDAPPATFDELVALIGRGYPYAPPTDQPVIFRTGDDADIEATVFAPIRAANSVKAHNGLASFLVLNNNNEFGNTNRFTDINGLQVYGDNYVIDNYTGLAYFRLVTGNKNWNDSIDEPLSSSQSGFTDWFLPSINQLDVLKQKGEDPATAYSPFSYANTEFQSSTTNDAITTQNITYLTKFPSRNGLRTKSATTVGFILCRKHF